MAYYDTTWYLNFGNGTSTGHYAVPVRPQNTAVVAGALRRQSVTPTVGQERVFVCIVAGTTANTTGPTWVITRGAKTTDGTVTWQECTGASAVNGDVANTATWAQAKVIGTPTLGAIIKRNNGASYQICTTAGTMAASEPSFSDTAGVTTNDGTSVWTSLGTVGSFTGGGAPFARIVAACASTWFSAGNTIYVGHNHAESQATGITPTPNGSASTVSKIVCHNSSGSYPPVSSDLTTGATISTTGAVNINFSPATGGGFYFYGLTFKSGIGQAGTQNLTLGMSGCFLRCDNCSFELATTGANATIGIGSTSTSFFVFNNTTVKFANIGQNLFISNGIFVWQNTGQILVSGSSVPTELLVGSTNNITVVLEAIDLSQLTGSIASVSAFTSATGSVLVKDCKLHASLTFSTPANFGIPVQFVRSSASV